MRADSGVATTIGIVLLVGAVFMMGAGAAVVLTEHDEPPAPVARGFHVTNDADGIRVLLAKGEPIPVATATLHLITDNGEEARDLSVIGEGLGESWEPSEHLCILGYRPGCDHGVDPSTFQGLRLVAQEQVSYEWFGTPALQRTGSQDLSGAGGGQTPAETPAGGDDEDGGDEDPEDGDAGDGDDPPAAPGQPDLSATIQGPTPASPVHGDQVTFSVVVSNNGDAATDGPFEVRFYVDGTLVSTENVAATAAGETRTVASDPWTATTGDHVVTVEVDSQQAVEETSEGNNQDEDALTVEVGHPDPGHAYEDVNNDVRFTQGLDIAIPDAEVLDGAYEVATPGHGLVVPSSVGNITADAVALQAGSGGHLVLGTNLTASQGALRLTAGTHLNATSVSLQAEAGLVNLTAGGPLKVTGAGVQADTVLHLNGQGTVRIEAATLEAGTLVDPPTGNKVLVCHYPPGQPDNVQTIDLPPSAVDTHDDHHGDYVGACVFDDGILISTGTPEGVVHAAGAVIEDPDDTAVVVPRGATVSGTPAQGSVVVHDPEPVDDH